MRTEKTQEILEMLLQLGEIIGQPPEQSMKIHLEMDRYTVDEVIPAIAELDSVGIGASVEGHGSGATISLEW